MAWLPISCQFGNFSKRYSISIWNCMIRNILSQHGVGAAVSSLNLLGYPQENKAQTCPTPKAHTTQHSLTIALPTRSYCKQEDHSIELLWMETCQTCRTCPDAPRDSEQSASVLKEISKLWNTSNSTIPRAEGQLASNYLLELPLDTLQPSNILPRGLGQPKSCRLADQGCIATVPPLTMSLKVLPMIKTLKIADVLGKAIADIQEGGQ